MKKLLIEHAGDGDEVATTGSIVKEDKKGGGNIARCGIK